MVTESADITQIKLETIVSIVLLCLVVVSSTTDLKPVKWREWANLQEDEAPGYILSCSRLTFRAGNILEHRPGFVDIRARRKAFLARKGLESVSKEKQ